MVITPLPTLPTEFIASARDDLSAFPDEVKETMGHAIYLAQIGGKHLAAKPLRGDAFKGAGTLEIVEDFAGNTYRAVYHLNLAGVVYVLHAFQKKSKTGITTPKHEIDLIKNRIKQAQEHYQQHYVKKAV